MADVELLGCTLRDTTPAGAVLAGIRFEGWTFERADPLPHERRPRWPQFRRLQGIGRVVVDDAAETLAPYACAWTDRLLSMGSFAGLDLGGARFERCSITKADLDEVTMTGAVFEDCDLAWARFVGADLRGVICGVGATMSSILARRRWPACGWIRPGRSGWWRPSKFVVD